MTIKAILFDLDDTLYDEKKFVKSGFKEVSKYVGLTYKIDEDNFFKELINIFEKGYRGNIFNIALENANIFYDEKTINKMVEIYRNHMPKIKLETKIKKLLSEISKDYLLGIITDGYFEVQKKKVKALKIERLFDCIIYTDEYGKDFWKPNIFPYKLALEKLQMSPKETIYIGDNPHKDFIGAKSIGIVTVRILQEGREYSNVRLDKDHEADYEIRKLNDIINLLKKF